MKPRARIVALLSASAEPLIAKQIGEICAIGDWRLWPHLAALERDQRILSDNEPGPYPRRRLYRIGPPDGAIS